MNWQHWDWKTNLS